VIQDKNKGKYPKK